MYSVLSGAAGQRLQAARRMGGDAIVGVGERREVVDTGEGVNSDAVLSGTVIRSTASDCVEPPALP